MTCIVGLVHNGSVYMGCDSIAVDIETFEKVINKQPKIFMNGDFLIGYAGSFRTGQIIQHCLDIPKQNKGTETLAYIIKSFIPAVKEALKNNGNEIKDEEVESFSGHFLVGYKGRLFNIQENYSIIESSNNQDSIGCGASFAKGSLYSSKDLEPAKRVELALEAATEFSVGVSGPFYIDVI